MILPVENYQLKLLMLAKDGWNDAKIVSEVPWLLQASRALMLPGVLSHLPTWMVSVSTPDYMDFRMIEHWEVNRQIVIHGQRTVPGHWRKKFSGIVMPRSGVCQRGFDTAESQRGKAGWSHWEKSWRWET